MNWKKFIIAIVVCQLAGIIGSLFTKMTVSTWYATLVKPEFSPPSWLFGPVWITLYFLMGYSAYLVWEKKAKVPLIIFGIQLVLNALWSPLFFGLQNPTFAFVDIIFLWIAIYITIIAFFKVSRTAAWLLFPYWLWVSFATFLNYMIMTLN